MIRCILEIQVSRPNADPNIHGTPLVTPQQNFRKTSKQVRGTELHLLLLLKATYIQPFKIFLIKPLALKNSYI